jgi:hypothetical protein
MLSAVAVLPDTDAVTLTVWPVSTWSIVPPARTVEVFTA